MTEFVGQITASTIQAEADLIASSVTNSISPGKFVFWVGLDGTNNIASNPAYSNDQYSTAIGAMKDQINLDDKNIGMAYKPGVGTPGTQIGSAAFPLEQMEMTAREVIQEFAVAADKWLSDNPGKTGADVTMMMATFSRASGTGAIISQILYTEGLSYEGEMIIPPGQNSISQVLALSPVNTGTGDSNLAFVGVENPVTTILAKYDFRENFVQGISPYSNDIYISGTHGDIGAVYDNKTGGILLQEYTDLFNTIYPGLMDTVLPTRQYDGSLMVDIHAETFSLNSWWNISYGSYADDTALRTMNAGTLPTIEYTANGSIETFVDYKGDTIVTTRVNGAVESVAITPAHTVYDNSPFAYNDGNGNSFATKVDAQGKVLTDLDGNIICTVTATNLNGTLTQCDVTLTGKFLSISTINPDGTPLVNLDWNSGNSPDNVYFNNDADSGHVLVDVSWVSENSPTNQIGMFNTYDLTTGQLLKEGQTLVEGDTEITTTRETNTGAITVTETSVSSGEVLSEQTVTPNSQGNPMDRVFIDIASFIIALRSENTAAKIITSASLMFSLAKANEVLPQELSGMDNTIAGAGSILNMIGAIQGLQSNNALLQTSSAIALIQSSNNFYALISDSGTGFLEQGSMSLELLSKVGAIIGVANLATNLDDMLENGQVIPAINSIVSTYQSVAFAFSWASYNPYVFAITTIISLFGGGLFGDDEEEPPPPPPVGEAVFTRDADGSLGYTLNNPHAGTAGSTYTLAANVENGTLTNTVAFTLNGNSANNTLTGNAVVNTLNGGAGNDVLNGGLGNDILTGGLGNDLFRFSSALSGTNIDTISDFIRGTDDIALDTAIFTKLLNDTNLTDNIVVSSFGNKAFDANDYLIFNSYTKALYYDADGSGFSYKPIQFATLTNVATVSASDFVVI